MHGPLQYNVAYIRVKSSRSSFMNCILITDFISVLRLLVSYFGQVQILFYPLSFLKTNICTIVACSSQPNAIKVYQTNALMLVLGCLHRCS